MENIWLKYAKRLQALSSTGLFFTKDEYDRERYEEILNISLEMMSLIGEIPIERIENLVTNHSKGYVTPKVDVRGAVFQDEKILLVKEKSDGRWTLPGGFAEVGLSPAQNIEKEIKEEAGIDTRAKRLFSIRHKPKRGYDQDIREFYKLFFICEKSNDELTNPGLETSEVKFFAKNEIPPLSTSRVIEEDLMLAWRFSELKIREAVFD